MAAEDLTRRVQQLSQAVLDKERELQASQSSAAFIKQDLDAAKAELSAAREELRNEATKSSLLEQRLKRVTDELQQTRSELSNSTSERDTLNRTLGRVHDQLSTLKTEAHTKSVQLSELQIYYDGVLQAKEESIRSLQALLDAQQRQSREQQDLWEEQRRSLKTSLTELSDRVAASHMAESQGASSSVQAAALAEVRSKLAQAEKAAVKASERDKQLVETLRHRERQVAKLKARLGQNGHAVDLADDSGCDPVDCVGRPRRVNFADPSEDTGDTAMSAAHGLSPLRHGGKGAHLEQGAGGSSASLAALQASLQHERRKREAVKLRLAGKEREVDDLREQVSRMRSELRDAAAGGSVQLADELLRAHRRIQELEQQVRRAREESASPVEAKSVRAVGGPGVLSAGEHLAIVRQRLVRQRQEFEQFLERVVGDVLGRSGGTVVLREDLKALMDKHLSRIDTIASMSALPQSRRAGGLSGGDDDIALADVRSSLQQPASPQHRQHQHSLFVVRAAWSTLRRALMGLQEAVSASLEVSNDPAVSYLQGADFLSRLMREWAVGDKSALDAAVEASMSAAVALVQEAGARLQCHAVEAGVAKQQVAEAQEAVAQLRLANELVQREGEKRTAEARSDADELRLLLDKARNEVGRLQAEAAERQGELVAVMGRVEAAQAAARRADEVAAAAEADRSRLKKTLTLMEFDKGSVESSAHSRDEERVRLTRALSDAQSTIALLHNRLEAYQVAGSTEITALKTKIRDVVTVLESPNLPQLHAMMLGAGGAGGAGAGADEDGIGLVMLPAGMVRGGVATPRRGARARMLGGTGSRLETEESLNAMALGLKAPPDDPWVMSDSLSAALDSATSSCSAALHRMALLELAHHDIERGVTAVEVVRDHLASAAVEMSAGRMAFGEVLLTELLTILDKGEDVGTAHPSAPVGLANALVGRQGSRGSVLPRTPRGRAGPTAAYWHQVATAAAISSQAAAAATCGGGGEEGERFTLREQLAAARDQGQHLARHLKNVEGLLMALKNALPEWLELATARLTARHRTELSRLRGLLGGQLAALRRDVWELRSSCAAAMEEAGRQATETLQQASQMSVSADRDRQETMHQLNVLQRDLSTLLDSLPVPPGSNGGAPFYRTAKGGRWSDPEGISCQTGLADLPYGKVSDTVSGVVRMVSEMNLRFEQMRREVATAALERDSMRASSDAIMAHSCQLLRSVAEAVPLPEMLVVALMNKATSHDPSMSRLWCGQLRDCLAGHMAGVMSAAEEGLQSAQVQPLKTETSRLRHELKATKRKLVTLEARAKHFVADSAQALESCRQAASEAARAVLDSVMAGVRDEMAMVRGQVSELEEGSAEVVRQINAAWTEQLAVVRGASVAAVSALEESVALLQAELGNEADAHDALRAESEAAAKDAAQRLAAESQRVRALTVDLAATRERLSQLEASESTLEGENRGLRKALRQRDAMAFGLNLDGQSVAATSSTGLPLAGLADSPVRGGSRRAFAFME